MSRPGLPPQAFQTFALQRPKGQGFWRTVSCTDAGCMRQRNGWRTVLDISTSDGRATANWIQQHSGRTYTVTEQGPIVTFTFVAGQTCFERHQQAIEREPLYIVRDGDGRGNPTGRRRQHTSGSLWVENMSEELDKVRHDRKQG